MRYPAVLTTAGRRMIFCSAACRQKAYRARGGHALGTTGAQRRRSDRHASAEHGTTDRPNRTTFFGPFELLHADLT